MIWTWFVPVFLLFVVANVVGTMLLARGRVSFTGLVLFVVLVSWLTMTVFHAELVQLDNIYYISFFGNGLVDAGYFAVAWAELQFFVMYNVGTLQQSA